VQLFRDWLGTQPAAHWKEFAAAWNPASGPAQATLI
jgi:hypothetical protein